MGDITEILDQLDKRHPDAAKQLFALVYDELRSLASAKLAQERSGHTLQATALVHEAYLRLMPTAANSNDNRTEASGRNLDDDVSDDAAMIPRWTCRNHFFAAAAEAMRRILVDSARRKKARKHGGDHTRQELLDSDIATAAPDDEILAVHDALFALEAEDRLASELVKLHYFGGFTLEEIAELMGLSRATAYRLWTYARAWLRAELEVQ